MRVGAGYALSSPLPSGDSPFARSIQYSDVTHKTVIGTGIVRPQLAQHTGFGILQIRAPVLPVLDPSVDFAVCSPIADKCNDRSDKPCLS